MNVLEIRVILPAVPSIGKLLNMINEALKSSDGGTTE